MSIMEAAMERAKRRHEEEARKGKSTGVGSSSLTSRRVVEEPAVRAVTLDLPRLEINEQLCVANRILIGSGNDRYSIASDAYRIIRTRLLLRLDSRGWNSIAVTSAGPAEGKSVTVLNLGLALASEKKRNVVLLDLDLRNPSLCQYLGARPRAAIGDFLVGNGRVEDLFSTFGNDSLVLAGGDSTHENSAELLGSQRLDELLAYIRNLDPNALIIADLPPILSVADAMVVAPKLSATVLVVAEGVTRRDGFARSLEVLGKSPMAGVVLNKSLEAVQHYYG
jgi:protein-tyrosine kinase